MRVIIIGDEQLTAKKLVELINELIPDAVVMGSCNPLAKAWNGSETI